jgi:hypothetical protein
MLRPMLAGVLALVLAAAVSSSPAFARSTVRAKLNVELAAVSMSGNRTVEAGTVTGTFGDGAIILHNTISGLRATSTGTVWYSKGTIDVKAAVKATMQPDGSFVFSGKGRVTGGTGKFSSASGRLTVTGSIPPNDTVHSMFTITSTLSY